MRRKRDDAKALAEAQAVVALKENTVFVDMLRSRERRIHDQWEKATTTEAREDCWYRLRGLKALYAEMAERIDRGNAVVKKQERAGSPERASPAKPTPS